MGLPIISMGAMAMREDRNMTTHGPMMNFECL